jgi:ABC-type dipeptide/oligopeptide/nickel transport system ATPase component
MENLNVAFPSSTTTVTAPILEIKDLKTYFFLERSTVRALDGVNLSLPRKTTLGLVGESGCGKSVMAMSVMRLIQSPPWQNCRRADQSASQRYWRSD